MAINLEKAEAPRVTWRNEWAVQPFQAELPEIQYISGVEESVFEEREAAAFSTAVAYHELVQHLHHARNALEGARENCETGAAAEAVQRARGEVLYALGCAAHNVRALCFHAAASVP